MVSSFNVVVQLNIARDLLWQLRATPVFTRFMVECGALQRMESTPAQATTASDSCMTRKQVYVPSTVQIPDVVRSIIDESLIEVTDTQVWDDEQAPYEQSFSIQPSVLAEYIKSTGKLLMHELQPDVAQDAAVERCLHVLEGECSVDIPFVGSFVEQAIISNMHEFYAGYAEVIDQFKVMLTKTYGDGSEASLRQAVQRVIAEHKSAQ